MVAHDGDTDAVPSAKRAIDITGSLHAAEDCRWAKPWETTVIKDEQATRSNQGSKHVMVEWEGVDASGIRVESSGKESGGVCQIECRDNTRTSVSQVLSWAPACCTSDS